jgi:hypothetical protein
MKTPMQELINQVEQWMLDDKEVLKNPPAWPEYLLIHANQMIEVKSEFIEMCKAMLEKEKEQIVNAWIDDRFPLDKEWVKQCAEKYYNETYGGNK